MDEYRQRESLSFEKVSRRKKHSRYFTWSLENPVLIVIFVSWVGVFLVFWMGTHLGAENSVISIDDIDTVAKHDYKAPRDFTYDRVDEEATARVREQRAAEVYPIYTWNNSYYEKTLSDINSAFEFMRDTFTKYRDEEMLKRIPKLIDTFKGEQVASNQSALLDAMFGPFEGEKAFDEFLTTRPIDESELARSLEAWSNENRPEFEAKLGVKLDDELFAWFVREGFSRDVQDEIVKVINTVLSQRIVNSRATLDISEHVTIQWFEGIDRRSKVYSDSEKKLISSLADSQALMRSLVREKFVDAPESIATFLLSYVRENLSYDDAATEREKNAVRDKTAELRIIEEYKKGQTIITHGNRILKEHYELFDKMMQGQSEYENWAEYWSGIAIVIVLMGTLICVPILKRTGSKRQKNRDILFLFTSILIFALGIKSASLIFSAFDSVYYFAYTMFLAFPFAAGGMLLRIVINHQYAIYYAVMAIILTTLLGENLSIVLPYAIVSTLASCFLISRPKRSNAVLIAGFRLGLLCALMGVAVYMISGVELAPEDYIMVAFLGVVSGLLSSGMVMIGLPLAESIFGYATSNKLLELSNLEHPALKTLFMEAPGTYQHSIMVGSLNEAAADAIGANAILARVGGYYHDIGKTKNAQYFAENQHGDNPHNRLKPNMSALILKAHEKDGLEIAHKYHLPKDIIDFIISHHGTSRIEYFYQRAKEQQTGVREEDYRYPGPRPQTRETGICMVSDMVEAAVRTLPDKSPDRIKVLVRKLINHKFADGQFDECDLTLRDLNDIADAVCGILNAFYHHRPEYPDQKKAREKADADKRAKEASDAEKKSSDGDNSAVSQNDNNEAASRSAVTDHKESDKSNDSVDKSLKSDNRSLVDVKSDKDNKSSNKSDKDNKSDKSLKSDNKSKTASLSNVEHVSKSECDNVKEARSSMDNPKVEKNSKSDKDNKSDKQKKSNKADKDDNAKSDSKTKSDNDKVNNSKSEKSGKSKSDKSEKTPSDKEDNSSATAKDGLSLSGCSDNSEAMEDTTDAHTKEDLFEPENSALSDSEVFDTIMDEETMAQQEECNEDVAEANALLKDDQEISPTDEERKSEELEREAQLSSEVYELSLSSHVDVFKKS